MVDVFFAYSHKDETLRDQLEAHLSQLKREGIIGTWHDRRIGPGNDIDLAISQSFAESRIILLLVSPDFLASDYCYEIEMKQALARHQDGSARVIPVILRPCDWHTAPFGRLKAVPSDGRPVTKYPDRDDAFLEVARAVREAAEEIAAKAPLKAQAKVTEEGRTTSTRASLRESRSSNLRTSKTFSDRDKDAFLKDAFEFIANFFDASLSELKSRNPEIDTDFTRIDALRFSAAVYRTGKIANRCRIWRGGNQYDGIKFSLGEGASDGSYNEALSVEADAHSLYLRPLGMDYRGSREQHLTFEGAAEYLWSFFIEPLQR